MKLGDRLHRWRLWLTDGWDGWLWDATRSEYRNRTEWLVDVIDEHIAERLQRATCGVFGHEPIRDQCGRPEHDACAWCRRSMPGAAAP